eukprot:GDKH01002356.1.p1 GENE.GDKH01002356.1~~GDKH01002356.1.p1  ORF type:complete len:449 (-),score=136.47 GDKH01002356.1:408-1754(-)
MRFLVSLMVAAVPVVVSRPAGGAHSRAMTSEVNGDKDLIDWTTDDFDPDTLCEQIDYRYIARDPVDVPKINSLIDELYALAEKKSELVSFFRLHAGDASFGKVWSRIAADVTLNPFTDGSAFNFDFMYKKALSIVGLQNQFSVTASYNGNTFKKLRYVLMKYVLPDMIADFDDEELPKHTIRSFFEDFCPVWRKQFHDILEEVSKMSKPSEKDVSRVGDALMGAALCDSLEAIRTESDFSKALTFLTPSLSSYKKALSILDPRPWVAKLFSGYEVKIVDCQDFISRWVPLYHCKPYASVYVKVGASGVASTWAHLKLLEGGIDLSSIAYAPTYGTGMFTGHNIDILAYAVMKTLQAHLGMDSFREKVLEVLEDFMKDAEDSEVYAKFLEFQKEFDAFDWEHEDFGWDEDEDLKEKRRHADDDDEEENAAPTVAEVAVKGGAAPIVVEM